MSLFIDKFCQICDKFLTKQQWNKQLLSSRPLRREVNGFLPAVFYKRN